MLFFSKNIDCRGCAAGLPDAPPLGVGDGSTVRPGERTAMLCVPTAMRGREAGKWRFDGRKDGRKRRDKRDGFCAWRVDSRGFQRLRRSRRAGVCRKRLRHLRGSPGPAGGTRPRGGDPGRDRIARAARDVLQRERGFRKEARQGTGRNRGKRGPGLRSRADALSGLWNAAPLRAGGRFGDESRADEHDAGCDGALRWSTGPRACSNAT